MNAAVLHYYRKYREHGYTAEAALASARSFVHFRKRLAAMVKPKRKRKGALL
jgi:hypothetical protein